MRIIPFLIMIVTAAVFTADAKTTGFFVDSGKADSWYMQASLYEQDGELEEAAKLLERVLDNVDDEYIFLKLANVYQRLGDKEMTVYTLERGIREHKDSHVLIGALADTYRADPKTYQDAVELYNKAFELSGENVYAEGEASAYTAMKDYNSAINVYDLLILMEDNSDWLVKRAALYEKLGLKKEAIDDYIWAAGLDGNFMAAAKLSDYYVAEGNSAEAIKYLKMVLAQSPNLTIAKFRLAEILRKMGNTAEAEQYYSDTLEFLNESEKVYVLKQLASISFSKQDYEKAEEYFVRAYELDGDIKTAYSIALLAENVRNTEQAEVWYNLVLEKRPDFVEAKKRLAIIKLRADEPEKALEILSGVEELYQDVEFRRIKSQAFMDKGDLESARSLLEVTLKENPNETRLYMELALVLDKIGRRDEAVGVAKKGMIVFPDDAGLQNFIGYMYAEKGINLDEAMALIKSALEKKPKEPAYLDSLGWVYYKKGMYDKAYPLLKEALKGAPEEDEIKEHMKAVLEKLGIKKSLDDILKED